MQISNKNLFLQRLEIYACMRVQYVDASYTFKNATDLFILIYDIFILSKNKNI